MKLKIQLIEGFDVTIWRNPIVIETDDFPELKDKSQDEVMEYLNRHSGHMAAVPGEDSDDWSLYDELINQDKELEKEKNNEVSIVLWTE